MLLLLFVLQLEGWSLPSRHSAPLQEDARIIDPSPASARSQEVVAGRLSTVFQAATNSASQSAQPFSVKIHAPRDLATSLLLLQKRIGWRQTTAISWSYRQLLLHDRSLFLRDLLIDLVARSDDVLLLENLVLRVFFVGLTDSCG